MWGSPQLLWAQTFLASLPSLSLSLSLSLSHTHTSAAFDYLKNHPLDPVDIAELDETCGVGVVITRDQIQTEVDRVISGCHEELMERRYRFNIGKIMSTLAYIISCVYACVCACVCVFL